MFCEHRDHQAGDLVTNLSKDVGSDKVEMTEGQLMKFRLQDLPACRCVQS